MDDEIDELPDPYADQPPPAKLYTQHSSQGVGHNLPPARRRIAEILASSWVESLLGVVIFFNVFLVVLETDCRADRVIGDHIKYATEEDCPSWMGHVNKGVLSFYCCELALRVHVWRLKFFTRPLLMLDMFVVGIDLFIMIVSEVSSGEAVPFLSLLRVARLLKLTRSVRLMMMFPELNLLLRSLAAAFRAIFWGVVMILFILMIFGVLAVQLIHQVNLDLFQQGYWTEKVDCYRCPHAFESVPQSILTFLQQIIAGDSWGTVTVPLVEQAPITVIFFLSVLVLVSLAIMNLILAVIVEKASEAKQDSNNDLVKKKEKEFMAAKSVLLTLYKEIDRDESGYIDQDEILEGFRTNEQFQKVMTAMDVTEDEINVVFEILDRNNTGKIDYLEWIDELHKMKTRDSHTLLTFTKHHVAQIKRELDIMRKEQRHLGGAVPASAAHVSVQNGSKVDPAAVSAVSQAYAAALQGEDWRASMQQSIATSVAEAEIEIREAGKAMQDLLNHLAVRSSDTLAKLQVAMDSLASTSPEGAAGILAGPMSSAWNVDYIPNPAPGGPGANGGSTSSTSASTGMGEWMAAATGKAPDRKGQDASQPTAQSEPAHGALNRVGNASPVSGTSGNARRGVGDVLRGGERLWL